MESITENETTDSNFSNSPHPAYTFTCALFMLALCTIGAFGNSLSIFIFTRRSMRSSINVLLTGLSGIDLSVLTFAVIVYVVPGLNSYGHFGDLRTLELIIVFSFYQISMIAQTCSVWTFALISLERYLAVCKPFQAQRMLTLKRARCAQLIVVVFAVSYNLVRFWEYSFIASHYENGTWSEAGYERHLRKNYSYFIGYYTAAYVIVHFFAPFLLISILNALIIKAVSHASILRQTLAPKRASSLGDSFSQRDAAVMRDAQRQGAITRMVIIVTLIFLCCNTLPFVLNIWEAVDSSLFDLNNSLIAYIILDVSNILVVLNSSTNFVVYAIYCRQYRRYARRLCCLRQNEINWRSATSRQFDSISDASKIGTNHATMGFGNDSRRGSNFPSTPLLKWHQAPRASKASLSMGSSPNKEKKQFRWI